MGDKRRIAFLSTMNAVPWGGSELLWQKTALAAVEQGHQVLAQMRAWPTCPKPLRELERAGVSVHRYPILPHPRLDRIYRSFWSRYRATLAFDPEVIVVSQGSSLDFPFQPALVQLLDATSAKINFVCQLADDVESLPDAQRAIAQRLYAKANRVAFVSQHNADITQRQIARSLPNAVVVRNPVNLPNTDVVPWPDDDGPVRFACVARLDTRHKGMDILLETFSGKVWRDRDWRLSFFGEGPDRLYIEELIEYYKLGDRVNFAGHVDSIREIWQSHHALVMASRREGMPISVIEAMLCGRPCILTRVAGHDEWITDNEHGFLGMGSASIAFADAFERAWQVRSRWRDIGILARERAFGFYDPCPEKSLLDLILDAS